MSLPKILECQTKIRFQDCDPFNHLNNAAYINYMINAREDQVEKHYKLDIFEMAKNHGVSWVVSTNQIAYMRPALLMETVTVQSQLIHFNESELFVELRMYNEDKTELKAVMWSTFVHFNLLKQKRWKHDEQLQSLFESVKNPTPQSSFEERIKSLKPQKV